MANSQKKYLIPPHDELIHPFKGSHPLWLKVLLVLAAIVCMVLGFVLWLIPVITGIPFWIIGFIILAAVSDKFRKLINRLDHKLPARARIALRHARDRIRRQKQ
ncbi:MAG TPA: hypothetical protein VMZ06_09660 [Candidatus Bathyarchaeia archaeon]|nr:hypothetical protein [Candidatus Bathyarchaeia archaeon]